MNDSEIIEVVTAHKNGKNIQCVPNYISAKRFNWETVNDPILWDFSNFDYRVDPKSRKHGRSGYVGGCRCSKCCSSNRVYQLKYLRKRQSKGIADGHGKVKRK